MGLRFLRRGKRTGIYAPVYTAVESIVGSVTQVGDAFFSIESNEVNVRLMVNIDPLSASPVIFTITLPFGKVVSSQADIIGSCNPVWETTQGINGWGGTVVGDVGQGRARGQFEAGLNLTRNVVCMFSYLVD